MTNALAKMEKVDQWLAEASTAETFAEIGALAEAGEAYARAHHMGIEMLNHCVEIQARAGRGLGLFDTGKHGGDHKSDEARNQDCDSNLDFLRKFNPAKRRDFKTLAKLSEGAITTIVRNASRDGRKMSWLRIVEEARTKMRGAVAKEREKTVVEIPPALICADFQSAQVPDASVDLIVTDPPYSPEGQNVYGDLSEFAMKVLRPGGVCVAYSGHLGIGQNILALSEHLEFMWLFGMRHTEGMVRFRKFRILVQWRPIIVCYKEPLEAWWPFMGDLLQGGGREKDFHEWQQAESEAAYFIGHLCPKGGVVLDPMCGGGTTLAAAKTMGMNYIGIDINPEAIQSSARRLEGIA